MPEEHEHKPGKGEKEDDVAELKEILGAVSEFLASLKQPIKELLDTIAQSLSGEKLGREVASFYKQLIESGIPEDMAKEMTKEYFRKRLESAPNLGSLMNMLKPPSGGAFKGPTKIVVARSPKDAIKQLEALKEAFPEKAEKIEKAIKALKALEEEEEEEKEEE